MQHQGCFLDFRIKAVLLHQPCPPCRAVLTVISFCHHWHQATDTSSIDQTSIKGNSICFTFLQQKPHSDEMTLYLFPPKGHCISPRTALFRSWIIKGVLGGRKTGWGQGAQEAVLCIQTDEFCLMRREGELWRTCQAQPIRPYLHLAETRR